MKSKSTDAKANGAIASGQLLGRASSILGSQEVGARGNTHVARGAGKNAKKPEAPERLIFGQTVANAGGNTRIAKNDEPHSFMGSALANQVLASEEGTSGNLASTAFRGREGVLAGQDEVSGGEDTFARDPFARDVPDNEAPEEAVPETPKEPDDGLPPIRAIDANDLSFFPARDEEDEDPLEEDPYDEWASNGREEAEEKDTTPRRLVVADDDSPAFESTPVARAATRLEVTASEKSTPVDEKPSEDAAAKASQPASTGAEEKPVADEGIVSDSVPRKRKRVEFPESEEGDEIVGEPRSVSRAAGSSFAFDQSHGSEAAGVVPFTLPEDEADAEVGNFSSVAELGAYLKSARERRGVSLAKVSETLRISLPNLEALEAGDTGHFIFPAYARGFLRTYARFLRIPEDKCLGVYAQLNTTQAYATSVYTPNKAARPRKTSPVWGILASLLIACLVGFGIWYFKLIDLVVPNNDNEPQTAAPLPSSTSPQVDRMRLENEKEVQRKAEERKAEEKKTGESVQANGASSQGATPQSHVENSSLKSLSLVDAGEREPLPAVVTPGSAWSALQGNATIAGQAGLASVPQPTVEETVTEAESLGIPQSDANTVVVVSEGTCWLSSTVDMGRSQQRTLQVGESVAFRFDHSLRLRVGNAGAVRIFYDGQEIERGNKGQVRNLSFPPKGDGGTTRAVNGRAAQNAGAVADASQGGL